MLGVLEGVEHGDSPQQHPRVDRGGVLLAARPVLHGHPDLRALAGRVGVGKVDPQPQAQHADRVRAVGAGPTAPGLFGADADRLPNTSTALHARLGKHAHQRCLAHGAAMTDGQAVIFAGAQIESLTPPVPRA